MSTFNWEVWDVAQDAASADQGGLVNLKDVRVVAAAPSWHVKPPDGSVAIVPQSSGEVELGDSSEIRSRISKGVFNFALIVLVIVLGFILVHDVMRESLTFEKLLYVLTPFLAGVTVGSRRRTASTSGPK